MPVSFVHSGVRQLRSLRAPALIASVFWAAACDDVTPAEEAPRAGAAGANSGGRHAAGTSGSAGVRAGTAGTGASAGAGSPLGGSSGEAGETSVEAGRGGDGVSGSGGTSARSRGGSGGHDGGTGGRGDGGHADDGGDGNEPGTGGEAAAWNGPACWLPHCGNGVPEGLEECDDGNADDSDECTSYCLRPGYFRCEGCEPARCGNGIAETYSDGCGYQELEQCDDGNNVAGDGCDPHCVPEATHLCPSEGGPCRLPVCGDGIWDYASVLRDGQYVGEECDDALSADCSGCLLTATCGDWSVGPHESCDDGNTLPGDGCSPDCQIESRSWGCPAGGGECTPVICGDGDVHPYRELCDDGNDISGDGCSDTCELEVCDGGACRVPRCGDGKLDSLVFHALSRYGDFAEERCDDGNNVSGDGCSADCGAVEEGWVCPTVGAPCNRARCGDGVVTYRYAEDGAMREENCDDGNDDAGDGCTDCHPDQWCRPLSERGTTPVASECGNGLIEPGEVCDDGNTANDDGCTRSCQREPDFLCDGNTENCERVGCGNGQVDMDYWNGCTWAREECDDGNDVSGDGCSDRCEQEPLFECPWYAGGPCSPAACGDGVVQTYRTVEGGFVTESADPGGYCHYVLPHDHSTGCNDILFGPECNDHNDLTGDGCTPDCRLEPGPWVCPRTGPPYQPCHRAVCGDGVLEGFVEECDDGNAEPGDGCSDDCVNEICTDESCRKPACGDGFVDPIFHPGHSSLSYVIDEPCDDGNTESGDGCSDECKIEGGFICPTHGEACAKPRCGDGVVTQHYWAGDAWHQETCDDGNATDCDGCTNCAFDAACHPAFRPYGSH